MEDVIELIGDVAEPVVETLKDWGEDMIAHVQRHIPQYLRYAAYALKHLHL